MARGTDVEMQLTDHAQFSSPRQGEPQPAQPVGLMGVLRNYLVLEWAIIIAVVILGAALEVPSPRRQYVLRETLYWHSFPHNENTVPTWTVPLYSLVGPVLLFLVWPALVRGRPVGERRQLCTSFILAYVLCFTVTQCLKVPVGRLRPNFVRTCWPNQNITAANAPMEPGDEWGGFPVCDPTVKKSEVDEIQKSWPSGHSSMSAVGLGYVTFWAMGQLHVWSPAAGNARMWKLVLSTLPGWGAVAVGVTRYLDYWHYPSDILTGLALGFLTAFFVYRVTYPPLTHPRCDLPNVILVREEKEARGE